MPGRTLYERNKEQPNGNQRPEQKQKVSRYLPVGFKFTAGEICVVVAEHKSSLKENKASSPDCSRSAEPGKNYLRKQRLNQKQKKGAEKNGCRTQRGKSAPLDKVRRERHS